MKPRRAYRATVERMPTTACTQMLSAHLVDGAGHWVQQEQPQEVSRLLVQFLQRYAQRASRHELTGGEQTKDPALSWARP